jgi:hypothetical protein
MFERELIPTSAAKALMLLFCSAQPHRPELRAAVRPWVVVVMLVLLWLALIGLLGAAYAMWNDTGPSQDVWWLLDLAVLVGVAGLVGVMGMLG